jgi:hypothetical protein
MMSPMILSEAKSGKVKVIEEYEGVGQAVPERLEWHYVLAFNVSFNLWR